MICATVGATLCGKTVDTAQADVVPRYQSVPTELQGVFTDYTLTALEDDYDTLEKLDELRMQLGDAAREY